MQLTHATFPPLCHTYEQDHVREIADKWTAIDDEIWAKIICFERNRRIAKAYARKHELVVNGTDDEYIDGTTLGLNSFDNPDRDSKTRNIKQYIGQVSIKCISHRRQVTRANSSRLDERLETRPIETT